MAKRESPSPTTPPTAPGEPLKDYRSFRYFRRSSADLRLLGLRHRLDIFRAIAPPTKEHRQSLRRLQDAYRSGDVDRFVEAERAFLALDGMAERFEKWRQKAAALVGKDDVLPQSPEEHVANYLSQARCLVDMVQDEDTTQLQATVKGCLAEWRHRLNYPPPKIKVPRIEDRNDAMCAIDRLMDALSRGGDQTGGGGGKPPATPKASSERKINSRDGPRFQDWAFGMEHEGAWHVFRKRGARWQHQCRLTGLPDGRQAELLKAFAERSGCLSKTEVLRLVRTTYSSSDVRNIMGIIKPELSKLRRLLLQNIGMGERQGVDPLPYDKAGRAWQAAVAIGYAIQKDGETIGGETGLRFTQSEDLSAEERMDV